MSQFTILDSDAGKRISVSLQKDKMNLGMDGVLESLEWLVSPGDPVLIGQPILLLRFRSSSSSSSSSSPSSSLQSSADQENSDAEDENRRNDLVLCAPETGALLRQQVQDHQSLLQAIMAAQEGKEKEGPHGERGEVLIGEICPHHIRQGSLHLEKKACAVCGEFVVIGNNSSDQHDPAKSLPSANSNFHRSEEDKLIPMMQDGMEFHYTAKVSRSFTSPQPSLIPPSVDFDFLRPSFIC